MIKKNNYKGIMSKNCNQVGGGACSLCGAPGTTKTNCPLNPAAKNPNPAKHQAAAAAPASAKPKAKAASAAVFIPANVENFMNIIKNEHTKYKAILDKMPAATKKACASYVKRRLLTRWSVQEINDISSGVTSQLSELTFSQQSAFDNLTKEVNDGVYRISGVNHKDKLRAIDHAIDMNDYQLPSELGSLLSTILDLQKIKTPESQALLKRLMTFLDEYASYFGCLMIYWRGRYVVPKRHPLYAD